MTVEQVATDFGVHPMTLFLPRPRRPGGHVPYDRVDGAALDGAGADQGDFACQVVEAAGT
jgi:hypothetical protein